MKRYGKYNKEMTSLFDAYALVNPVVSIVPDITNVICENKPRSASFPGLKYIKIFLQKAGRGADLIHYGKVTSIDSDDGIGGTIISAKDDNKNINLIISNDAAQVRVIDSSGYIENEFVTNVKPTFSDEGKELTIINIEEL